MIRTALLAGYMSLPFSNATHLVSNFLPLLASNTGLAPENIVGVNGSLNL